MEFRTSTAVGAAAGGLAAAVGCCAWRRVCPSNAGATAAAEATGRVVTDVACEPLPETWQRPDLAGLERLHHELVGIDARFVDAREAALAAAHDSPEELAVLEQQALRRAEQDEQICAACASFESALREGQPEEHALAALDAVVAVPQGVRNKPQHLLGFAAARRQRHQPAAVRKAILSKIRAEQRHLAEQPQAVGAERQLLPGTRERLRAAQAQADKEWHAAVDRGRHLLLWSDHRAIHVELAAKSKVKVIVRAWNVLERQPDGVKPVVHYLPFLQNLKKMKKKTKMGSSAVLEQAMLDPTTVEAHAKAVATFVLRTLKQGQCDAFCLAEVGAPLITALRCGAQASGAVVAISNGMKSKSTNQAGACEARTAVVACSGTQEEDLVVEVEGKVRRYAALKVRPGLVVVAVHVMRNDCSEEPKTKTGEVLQALKAKLDQTQPVDGGWTVLAAGDWNFSWELLEPAKLGIAPVGSTQVLSALPGEPTTLGDHELHKKGIDGTLVLSPSGDATLAARVV